jgi:Uncharacterized protein conserved in bacteria (DUF2255)
MANFDADTLDELRQLQEVAIRTEKHPKTAVVIWVAVADDEVFVRSVRGTKGRWYRISRQADPPRWSLPAAGWRCRRSRRATPLRSAGRAANTCENTSRAPMRRRWCAPKSCRPRCGSNRADRPQQDRPASKRRAAVAIRRKRPSRHRRGADHLTDAGPAFLPAWMGPA